MQRLLAILTAVAVLGPPVRAEGRTKYELCLESAWILPAKVDGRPWDGTDGPTVPTSELAALSNMALSAAVPHAAIVGKLSGFVLAATASPDIRIRVTSGDRVMIQAPIVRDTLQPQWSSRNCDDLVDGDFDEKTTVEVWDEDADIPDPIAKYVFATGIPRDGVESKQWRLPAQDQSLGVLFTLVEKRAKAEPEAEKNSAVFDVGAGQASVVPIELSDDDTPGTLHWEFKSQGVSAGIPGALDDKIIEFGLIHPSGADEIQRLHKPTNHSGVHTIKTAGTWQLYFSNVGILRSTPRRIQVQWWWVPRQ